MPNESPSLPEGEGKQPRDAQHHTAWQPGQVPPPETAAAPFLEQAAMPLVVDLADGEWHRMHPLTLWANILTIAFTVFWVAVAVSAPITGIVTGVADSGLGTVGAVVLAVLAGLLVIAGILVWLVLSYRNTQFRLTGEVLEFRSGVFSRSNRQVRFDRLQSVNLRRTVFARIFGLTVLETSGASDEAKFTLTYLGAAQAESLRAELLRRASGARKQRAGAQSHAELPQQNLAEAAQSAAWQQDVTQLPGEQGPQQPVQPAPKKRQSLSAFVTRAVDDFASPELSRERQQVQAVVEVKPWRIVVTSAVEWLVVAVVFLVLMLITGPITANLVRSETPDAQPGFASYLWGLLTVGGFASILVMTGAFTVGQVVSNLQYTIVGTPDGLRIGRGVLSQMNDTVPPGRIHAVQVRQPWLWRPFKWYQVRVNRADVRGLSGESSENRMSRHVVLPVGTREDVDRVLALLLPLHMEAATSQLVTAAFRRGRQPEYTPAPTRSWWLHPLSWRVIGGAIYRDTVFFRAGWLRRRVTLVPGERIQSVTATGGPLQWLAGVGSVRINGVPGPVHATLPAVPKEHLNQLHESLAQLAVRAAQRDRSHRWAQAQAQAAVAAAHMLAEDARREGRPLDEQAQRMLEAERAWRAQSEQ